jgi:hypothetical protein
MMTERVLGICEHEVVIERAFAAQVKGLGRYSHTCDNVGENCWWNRSEEKHQELPTVIEIRSNAPMIFVSISIP